MTKRKKDRTIFRVMVLPLLSILAVELCVLVGSLLFGGVITKLNQNAQDMLAQQVENRGNYLLNDMIGNWSNLNIIAEHINEKIQDKLNHGKLKKEDFNENNENCVELLKELRPDLIEVMYNKQVSGIFLILNTHSLEPESAPETLPGIYLRDLDPTSTPSQRNEDILTERAPVEVVRAGRIATDTSWQPAFSKADSVEQPFFYKPFQAAYTSKKRLEAKDYGYWTTKPYCLSGDTRRAISYSIPLILTDGTVYGVLGIELLEDYMQSLLPCSELMELDRGSYLLAVSQKGDNALAPVLLSSELITNKALEELQFQIASQNPSAVRDSKGEYYGAIKPLVVYSNNAPFDTDKWYLAGISTKDNLFAFSRQMQRILLFSFVITFVIGLIGSLLVSYRLSKPIQLLSNEVEKAKKSNEMPILPDTGIREIDQFSDAIVRLGHEVIDSSTRFLRIMDMASVDLGGYEIKEGSDSVFVTDNYFPLLGVENIDIDSMTVEEFKRKHQEILNNLDRTISEDGSVAYQVPLGQGRIRYLRFENVKEGSRHVGLVEDVTASTLERMRVERERDCDGLTKLYARRGFRKVADELFLYPEKMKIAGLLMIDLDNLKTTNDRFGHKFGDIYIQTAGKCFMDNTPDNTVCARISGDEFLVLFYGFNSQDEIREKLRILYDAIHKVEFVLPDGSNMGLSASGGVAWYPADSTDLSVLMKYSDFAMYQVKRSKKGALKEFDAAVYQVEMEQYLQGGKEH